MKKSHVLKWSGFGLVGVVVASTLVFTIHSKNASRIVLSDEAKEQRIILHNADGHHACHCFMPLIDKFDVSDITDSSATFEWGCSSPSTYQVNYGTSSAKGTLFPTQTPDASYTKHSITVTGLKPNTEYHAGPSSICKSNCAMNSRANLRKEWLGDNKSQSDWTFKTKPPPTSVVNEKKNSAPEQVAVSDVKVARVTAKDVTITWKTNIPATSLVEYGLTAEYGMKSGLNSQKVYDHDIQLFDLRKGSTFHFRVVSYTDDAMVTAKTTASSSDYTFTTPSVEERLVNKKYISHEPNPCSDWTTFSYFCYQPMRQITIDVLTLSGKLVASLESPSSSLAEGWNKVRWNVSDNGGRPLKNGLYLYKMKFLTLNNNEVEIRSSNLRVVR